MKQPNDNPLSAKLLADVESYISKVYVEETQDDVVCAACLSAPIFAESETGSLTADYIESECDTSEPRTLDAKRGAPSPTSPSDLAERLEQLDESFARTVLRLIDERGIADVEVYKRANMSRQLFAKIRKDDNYHPTKRTACALAFALELDYEDALALLSRAGYTLSHSSKFDIIVEYFFLNSIYDIAQINMTLYAFDQQILG